MIDQFCFLSIQHNGISGDELTFSLKCVSQRFNIERFRETQQEVIVNFLIGKDVLVLQPTG